MLVGVVFFSALFYGEQFSYRDGGHFYYPLFQYIQSLWQSGEVPLWNPMENSGAPLLADPVSSLFYPGKLLFFLPFSYALAYRLYIMLHVLMCMVTAFGMARYWGSSILAAGVCGISYAFSGTVLMQYSNVVFLVGAAWIPVALVCGERAVRLRSWPAAMGLGVVLALQVLGGDPQAAYLSGMLAALYALGLWFGERRQVCAEKNPDLRGADRRRARQAAKAAATEQSIGWQQHRTVLLAGAASLALLLSLVQVLPSLQLARRSTRAFHELPRNVYELVTASVKGGPRPIIQQGENQGKPHALTDGLWGAGPPGKIRTYRYSTGPWRWIELIWPNITGQRFPVNQHWPLIWPAAQDTWTPTIYLGLLPLLLGISAVRLRRAPPIQIWLSGIMLFGLLGALGSFGMVWAGRVLMGTDFGGRAGDEVGGLYWLLTVLLPSFANFRYPSKLLVFMAIGMSGLAAFGWDRLIQGNSHAVRRLLLALIPISLLGLLSITLGSEQFEAWLAKSTVQAIDSYYGPLDIPGARQSVQHALLYTTVVATIGLLLCLVMRSQRHQFWAPLALLVLIVVDLGVANRWIVQTAPQSEFDATPHLLEVIRQAEAKAGTEDLFRIYRPAVFFPIGWGMKSSADRMEEIFQWSRDSLKPKQHLAFGLEHMVTRGAMDLHDYEYFYLPWPTAISPADRQRRPDLPAMTYRFPPLAFDMWNVKYFVLPKVLIAQMLTDPNRCINSFFESSSGNRAPVLYEPPQDQRATLDYQIIQNPDYFPRAWVVQDVVTIPPITGYRAEDRIKIIRTMLKDQTYNLRKTALVEVDDATPIKHLTDSRSQNASDRCQIIRHEARRIEIEVERTTPGLLVLAETYFPGWQATVNGTPATIFRSNRMMRSVVVPAGKSYVVFSYEPTNFWLSAMVSAAVWIALTVGAVVFYRQRE